MKDMALTAAEAKAEYGECAPCSTGEADDGAPRYPWGLSICLDTGSLKKLGLGLLPVGTEVMITAKAVITGTSSRERVKGENSQDMDIQLTALELSQSMTADDMRTKAASKLYK